MANTAQAKSPDAAPRTTPAPYLPFLTFQSAIESLEHGIPKKLDRTIWPSQSGLVQSQILMAFRFLGLVDAEDRPAGLLHELVEHKEHRKMLIGEIVHGAYADIISHDLTKMTPKMLDDAFEQFGVTGDTKRKAVTFFLKAAKFADVPMHPLLSTQVRNTGPRKKRAQKPKGVFIGDMNGAADPAYDPDKRPTSTQTAVLSSGGRLVLQIFGDPFALPSDERQVVFELVDRLRNIAAAVEGDGEPEDEQ